MNEMKDTRIVSLVLILIFAVSVFSGCGLVQVNPEKERAQVVAEVNGKEVLKGEVLDRLEQNKSLYYLTDEMNERMNRDFIQPLKAIGLSFDGV